MHGKWKGEIKTAWGSRHHLTYLSLSTDTPAHSKGGSNSPEQWARPSCSPQEGGCPPPKERESPPPPALQTVQLPRLALSPPPPAPPPMPPPTPSAPDPSLDFLRAQQETANAIRELAGTLQQGLAKLSEALSALLPLLPGTAVDRLPPPLPPPPPPAWRAGGVDLLVNGNAGLGRR